MENEEILQQIKSDIEKMVNRYKFEFADGEYLTKVNEEYLNVCRRLINMRLLRYDSITRSIHIEDPELLDLLVFVPLVFDEVSSVMTYPVYVNGIMNGYVSFRGDGKPMMDEHRTAHFGYKTTLSPYNPAPSKAVEVLADLLESTADDHERDSLEDKYGLMIMQYITLGIFSIDLEEMTICIDSSKHTDILSFFPCAFPDIGVTPEDKAWNVYEKLFKSEDKKFIGVVRFMGKADDTNSDGKPLLGYKFTLMK